MKKLAVGSRYGTSLFAIEQSDTIASAALNGAAASITVPADAAFAVFSGTDDFYVNLSATAVVPTVTAASGASELNPTVRRVVPGATVSVIGATGMVTVSFYK